MVNIRHVDLNLLVVFDALMVERSVTKAAERIGLTQPSTSNALTRLRDLFDDDLFVRTPEGMVPTAVALSAAEHIKLALVSTEIALNANQSFLPEDAKGTIDLLANDFIELTVVPKLMQAMRSTAPGIQLRTRPLINEDFAKELDTMTADIIISPFVNVPNRFHSMVLSQEPFDGIISRKHPVLRGNVSLEDYCACKHIAVLHGFSATKRIDDMLATRNISLDYAVGVSNLASVPPLVANSDVIGVIPRRLAIIADRELPVRKFNLPFHVPSAAANLIWGRGTDKSPTMSWFRKLLIETMSSSE